MADKERLIQLRDAVLANPEKHNQRHWASRSGEGSCGTTMCLAGTAVHLAGEQIDWLSAVEEEDEDGTIILVASRTRKGHFIETVAAKWLGLNIDEEGALFFTMDEPYSLKRLNELIERS